MSTNNTTTDNTTTAVNHDHRDDAGRKMGMWLFLFTELLLFGGLFLVYSIYRFMNPADFSNGSHHLDVFMGALNTMVLITSSLTVALSITAIQKGNSKLALRLLALTILLAIFFLVNKYFEWGHKIHYDLYPGTALFKALPPGEGLFYVLYYFMTGLHMIHVIVGAVILAVMGKYIREGSINSSNYVLLENGGLYWHLVDLIWIFLFPLLYLIH
ncbi:MAG TPA: cytochrome C oxidase subunit III [Bacteroidales bacterium]|nr:MAG: cytochrome C oxidase subunit III [Bacteroidetes bacterium GWE2_42_24]OFY26737.1 MAG: cytochrome C oxidase subunit III [Bacteroidetes bacterium GWF2_43_11]HBZ68000.1 cytochrome C oxidase subunit III [Bacteroidales bacterium]